MAFCYNFPKMGPFTRCVFFVYMIMFFAQLLPLSGNVQVRRLPLDTVLLA